jgi:hypothetical protein
VVLFHVDEEPVAMQEAMGAAAEMAAVPDSGSSKHCGAKRQRPAAEAAAVAFVGIANAKQSLTQQLVTDNHKVVAIINAFEELRKSPPVTLERVTKLLSFNSYDFDFYCELCWE